MLLYKVVVLMTKIKPYKILIFPCYAGCATGIVASMACVRVREQNTDYVKNWMAPGCDSTVGISADN